MALNNIQKIKAQAVDSNLLEQIESLSEKNRKLQARIQDLEKDQTKEANQTLQLAEYIIDNSPAILFRRLAAEKPEDRKMVYVSPNISRFGYQAEDLLSGKIMFRDFLYEEDSERIKKEIDQFVEEKGSPSLGPGVKL